MNETKGSRDQELAAFTDALLEGQEADTENKPPLAEEVEILARTLAPKPPPAGLRRKVRRCVAETWEQQRPLLQRLSELLNSLGRPRQRWAWATAAALIVAAVAAVLLLPQGPLEISGTATGHAGLAAWAGILVLAGILLALWIVRRR